MARPQYVIYSHRFTVLENADVNQVGATWDLSNDFRTLYEDVIIESNEDDSSLSPFTNVDSTCDYYLRKQFRNMTSHIDYKYLSLFCINCQSLNSHWDELNSLLINMTSDKFSFDIIGLTEIFQVHQDINYNIAGYHPLIYNTRTGEHGGRGGVGIYVRDHISFTYRNDISVFVPHIFESVFIEVNSNSNRPIVIGTIYRPNTAPKADIDIFCHTLSQIIETVKLENKQLILSGDFNLNLLNFSVHNKTRAFVDDLFSYGFIPLILKPTRVSDTSATLIDHIFTDKLEYSYKSGIIITDLANHFGTYTIMKTNSSNKQRQDWI